MEWIKNRSLSFAIAGFVTLILLTGFATHQLTQKKIKVLVITGGHGFEHKPFYDVFNSQPNISYDTLTQPQANALIASPDVNVYDVLLFYDMFDSVLPAEQQAYINLLNKGKAMIFLHHSLVSYQNWQEFVKIVGGQYHTKPIVINGDTLRANYEHDVTIAVQVVDKNHPVTKGINDFEILDEVYSGTEILTSVQPLLSTGHARSMRYLAWINHYGNSEVLYIQLGHGPTAYSNSNFRRLLKQGIEWSAAHHIQSK